MGEGLFIKIYTFYYYLWWRFWYLWKISLLLHSYFSSIEFIYWKE